MALLGMARYCLNLCYLEWALTCLPPSPTCTEPHSGKLAHLTLLFLCVSWCESQGFSWLRKPDYSVMLRRWHIPCDPFNILVLWCSFHLWWIIVELYLNSLLINLIISCTCTCHSYWFCILFHPSDMFCTLCKLIQALGGQNGFAIGTKQVYHMIP